MDNTSSVTGSLFVTVLTKDTDSSLSAQPLSLSSVHVPNSAVSVNVVKYADSMAHVGVGGQEKCSRPWLYYSFWRLRLSSKDWSNHGHLDSHITLRV